MCYIFNAEALFCFNGLRKHIIFRHSDTLSSKIKNIKTCFSHNRNTLKIIYIFKWNTKQNLWKIGWWVFISLLRSISDKLKYYSFYSNVTNESSRVVMLHWTLYLQSGGPHSGVNVDYAAHASHCIVCAHWLHSYTISLLYLHPIVRYNNTVIPY